jgi:hypothetical protein
MLSEQCSCQVKSASQFREDPPICQTLAISFDGNKPENNVDHQSKGGRLADVALVLSVNMAVNDE